MQRHAEPLRDLRVVAAVPVDELDDRSRLTEGANPLVETGTVDGVDHPHAFARAHGVRGARDLLVRSRHPKPCSNSSLNSSATGTLWPVASETGTSNEEIADRLESFAALLDLAESNLHRRAPTGAPQS